MTGQLGLCLSARSLLSKWGFQDGDEPDDYLDWLDDHGLPHPKDWHAVLRILVRKHLMPQVTEDVELYDIETSHNPIRAKTVDGREIDDYADYPPGVLDADVHVPYDQVYAAQQALDTPVDHPL